MKTFWRRKFSFAALTGVMLVSQCCCCFLPLRVQMNSGSFLSEVSAPAQAAGLSGGFADSTQALCWDEKLAARR